MERRRRKGHYGRKKKGQGTERGKSHSRSDIHALLHKGSNVRFDSTLYHLPLCPCMVHGKARREASSLHTKQNKREARGHLSQKTEKMPLPPLPPPPLQATIMFPEGEGGGRERQIDLLTLTLLPLRLFVAPSARRTEETDSPLSQKNYTRLFSSCLLASRRRREKKKTHFRNRMKVEAKKNFLPFSCGRGLSPLFS